MAEVEQSRVQLAANLAIVDAHLASRDYLAGSAFTAADIPIGVAAFRWFNLPITRPALPHLDRWYARMTSRAAFQQHCMAPLT
jgi:glutathione S-transferase